MNSFKKVNVQPQIPALASGHILEIRAIAHHRPKKYYYMITFFRADTLNIFLRE